MKDLISIVCTCYNHAEFTKETIESIWNQDYKNIEIIVVDDGSKDSSPQILTELAKQSPFPMEVILQENTGNLGLNRNRVFKRARGEFVVFFDGDDKFVPNILSKLVDKINKENADLLISTKYYIFGGVPTKEVEHGLPKNKSLKQLLDSELDGQGTFFSQVALFKKSIVDEIGGWDESELGDDMDFRICYLDYLIKHNKSFSCFDEVPVFYYRQHASNISKNYGRHFKMIHYSVKKYNKKHFPFATLKHYLIHNNYFKGMWRYIFFDLSNIRHYPRIIKMILDVRFPQFPKLKIITNFIRLQRALNKYYKENGSFPVCELWAGLSYIHGQSREDWIPNLAPKYIKNYQKDYIFIGQMVKDTRLFCIQI
jgi:glycosyltransferase involved in cell wall biosynthesis